jgi:two-component system C4-dicarboxylate transport response regulator DctD
MPELMPVLLVDDEAPIRRAVTQWLGLAGFKTHVHDGGLSALEELSADFPGILVTDLRMEGIDGLELLRRTQRIDPELPVVVITGHGDIETAVEAMRLGAYDFIEKPFAPERLLEVVRRASDKRRLVFENRDLRRAVTEQTLGTRIIGASKAAESLRARVAEISATDVSVILQGETGVGKKLVARCLHDFGLRKKRNFVAINCAGVPDGMIESDFFGHDAGAFTTASKARIGKIEQANDGTLFLDEIESLALHTQAKLLYALQERAIERTGSSRSIPVDVRPIAASKIDLRTASLEGRFRSDLYYRLSVVEITIPPLRERIDDIPLIFEHFSLLAAASYGREPRPVTPPLLNKLMTHEWPGNVRELRNAAERYALGLPQPLWPSQDPAERLSLAQQLELFERSLIERCLLETGGKISAVIERLDIPRRTLSEKMMRLGIDRKHFVSSDKPESADDSAPVGEKPPKR